MKHPVKISVIIPVYNVENYLPFALQSCVDQTLFDVEFICVNDGSTDNSLAILKEYAEKDARFKIIDKENGGLSSARNAGMKVAEGEYIMFLDSDDYLKKNACERVWIETQEGKTDIVVFGSDIIPNIPEPTGWYKDNLYISTKRTDTFDRNNLFYVRGSMPFVWRQAFSKKLIDEIGVLFDETVKFGEDTVFQMEVFPFATNIAYISDHLYVYRWRRNGSLMSQMDRNEQQKVFEHLNIANKIFAFWKKYDIFPKYREFALAWVIDFAGVPVLNRKNKKDEKLQEKFIEILKEYDLFKYSKLLDDRQKGLYSRLAPKKVLKKELKDAKRK